METKGLTEKTYDDAKAVVLDRFDESAVAVLDAVMRNPIRKICEEAGDIVYDNGVPVCFQSCMLRRLYLGDKDLFGKVAGLTCLKKGAPVEAYLDVRAAAAKQRAGSMMGFGNSQNAESAFGAHRLAKKKNPTTFEGPESCTRFLWWAVRPVECLAYFFRRKVLKKEMPQWSDFTTLGSVNYHIDGGKLEIRRLMEVRADFFDVLMNQYMKTNEGLVCSRTAEEVQWIFGNRITNGRCVVLGAFMVGMPVGYIIVGTDGKAKRWQILDWFALRNEEYILEALLFYICSFLRHQTPAMMLETVGFPMYIQPLLMKYLPRKRKIGHNMFSWGSLNSDFREKAKAVIESPASWFFGPYDGDLCLG